MKVRLQRLTLRLRAGTETVDFSDVTIFHGKIGVGKSTIANLVDFCFGSALHHETPALQEQFVEATLELKIEDVPLAIARTRGSNMVRVSWGPEDDARLVELPARSASGVRLEGTEVEVLSDLLFHVAGIVPPRVRKSKRRADSDLVRLSFRDLWSYCYLDQRSMDSSLFHLEPTNAGFERLKSRDVVRYVLGVEHEKIGALEAELDELRFRKAALDESAALLSKALADAGIGSLADSAKRMAAATERVTSAEVALRQVREGIQSQRTHAVDELRGRLRELAADLRAKEAALEDAADQLARDRRQRSELALVGTRFGRARQAREILGSAAFVECPRCAQALPARASGRCGVCDQPEPQLDAAELDVASADLKERIVEIERAITERERAVRRLRRQHEDARSNKAALDEQLGRAITAYDPAHVSQLVLREQDLAVAREQVRREEQLRELPAKVDALRAQAAALAPKEETLREQIRAAREAAAQHTDRLDQLSRLLLDTLVRAKMPGIHADDVVVMDSSTFYPEVLSHGDETRARRDFLSISSGGKTTVFKCCFALALHRLNAAVDGPLPRVLVMDTPMKNISERTNHEIFESFYTMLYELAATELKATQLVVIDKELWPPPEGFPRPFHARLMTPDDPEHPPLIRGYTE